MQNYIRGGSANYNAIEMDTKNWLKVRVKAPFWGFLLFQVTPAEPRRRRLGAGVLQQDSCSRSTSPMWCCTRC
jgi:hypothetical protein